MKNIILLCDFRDYYAKQALKHLLKIKYIKILCVVTLKKCIGIKIRLPKKVQLFYQGFPEKNEKLNNFINENKINLCISLGWPNTIKVNFIKKFKDGIVNIHPGLLPEQKGAHTTFYNIIFNRKYHGSTLHFINKYIDSGPIIYTSRFKSTIFDDANYVFHKSRKNGFELFKKRLKSLIKKNYKTKKNTKTKIYKKGDIKKFDTILLKKDYKGIDFWNLIRATNFGNNGIFFKVKKKKFKVISKIKEVK